MVSRVLVPMDDSEMAKRALEYAFEVHPDAEITVLRVVGEPSSMMGRATELALADDLEQAANDYAQDVFDDAREIADEHGKEITTEAEVGSPAQAIIDRAAAFDVVIVGSHSGTLTDRFLTGNVAKTVSRRSPVPVTVVR